MNDEVAIISDIHIHPWSEYATVDALGRNSRLMDCITVFSTVRRYMLEHSIPRLIIGGDIAHKKGFIHTAPFTLLVEELVAFKKAGLIVEAVDGNHDHADKTGSINLVDALAKAGLLVSPAMGCGVGTSTSLPIAFFSYCDDRDELRRRIDSVSPDGEGLAIFHHGFKGARVGTTLEYRVKHEIEPSDVEGRFGFVLSGHYHSRQRIGGKADMQYIGSPLEHTRSDMDDRGKKGFLIYSFDTNTIRVVTLKRPRFLKVSYEDLSISGVEDTIRGNFVDMDHDDTDPEALEKHLREMGAKGVRLIPRPKVATGHMVRCVVDPALAPATVLERYVRYKEGVEETKMLTDQETDLLSVGNDLINRAFGA